MIILWFMCLAGAAIRCFIVPDIGVCGCLWVIRLWVAMLAEMPDAAPPGKAVAVDYHIEGIIAGKHCHKIYDNEHVMLKYIDSITFTAVNIIDARSIIIIA